MTRRLIAILLLIVINAFFVGAELALVRARRPRLEARAREGDRASKMALRAMNVLPRMLSASQLGISLSSLGLGFLLAEWIEHRAFLGDGPAETALRIGLALAAVVYLHILLAELVPKAVALAQPEQMARWLASPLIAFSWLAAPVTTLLSRSSQLVSRRIRERVPTREDRGHSSEELRLLVEQSHEGGALQQRDAALLEGVFEFSEKNARDVMTPRTEMVAIPVDATLEDTLRVVEESGLSRFPVYDGTIDNIVGMALAKDLIPVLHRRCDGGDDAEFSLRNVLRDVHVIPGTREVEEVLADFKRLKEHMAVVLDEYGGTAGVVTMEDLLEEIVGEILDEYDEPDEPQHARGGELLVPGEMNIGEMNEKLGLAVADDEYTTIGGFVFGTLGRLPVVGDRVTAGGATFVVRSMEGRRIGRLAVRLVAIGEE